MNKLLVFFLFICLNVSAQKQGLTDQVLSPAFVINFDYKSAQLTTEAQRHLDSLVHLMKHQGFVIQHIEITGHCDSVASNNYNDILSLQRANSVATYLREHGISDKLITTIHGEGKRQPLNDNADEGKRANNRRVDIVFQLLMPATKDTVSAISMSDQPPARLTDTSKPTLDLSKLQVNDLLELKNINFYPNRHLILKQSKKNLEVLLNTMVENKGLRIEIRGHVCCLPDYQGDAFDEDSYKEDLSLERAKEIFTFLVDNGIEAERMTYIGLGGKYPKVKEFTEADKATNRRVEIKILSK